MSVTTKTGSNDFHGSAFAYYTPGALEGSRKGVQKAGQSVE